MVSGRHLLFELESVGVQIRYGIDQRSDKLNLGVTFIDWSDKKALPKVDMLIVTAIADYALIEKEMCETRDYPIISLEDIICDMETSRREL